MKKATLPILLSLGIAVAPGMAAAQGQHGHATGAPSGMRAEAGADLEMAQAGQVPMPQPQTQGNVTWLCGGIGQSEASFMKQQARDYDLQLTFASQTGAYLADVHVDIRDAQGQTVLQAMCDGPIMLVDLPRSGTYRIQADASGFTQNRTARVSVDRPSASNVVMTWSRQAVAQMEPAIGPVTTGGGTAFTGDGRAAEPPAGGGYGAGQPGMPGAATGSTGEVR